MKLKLIYVVVVRGPIYPDYLIIGHEGTIYINMTSRKIRPNKYLTPKVIFDMIPKFERLGSSYSYKQDNREEFMSQVYSILNSLKKYITYNYDVCVCN